LTYTDTLSASGKYYYAVTAANLTALGPVSNNESVIFQPCTLSLTSPNPTGVNSVALNWTAVPGADSYLIFSNTTQITYANLLQQTPMDTAFDNLSYIDTNLPFYGTFYYALLPYNSTDGSVGFLSNCVNVTYQLMTPEVNQPFPEASGAVPLSWAPVPGALWYNVYRSMDPMTDDYVLLTATTTSFFTDTLSTNNTYWYSITADNPNGESSASMPVGVFCQACTLSAISPNPTYVNSVTLNWSAFPWANFYIIFRNTTQITYANLLQQTALYGGYGITSYIDTSLPTYGTYYYAILPVNGTEGSFGVLSTCQNVTYLPVLPTPGLYPAIPQASGAVVLKWTSVTGALWYNIYRSTSPITSVSGLTRLTNVTALTYTDTLSTHGTYYYAVIAVNSTTQSYPASLGKFRRVLLCSCGH
jgi:hypothetical protein